MAIFGGSNSGNQILIDLTANDNATQTINALADSVENLNVKITGASNGSGANGLESYISNLSMLSSSLMTVGNKLGELNDGIIDAFKNAGQAVTDFVASAISEYRALSQAQGELAGVIGNDSSLTSTEKKSLTQQVFSDARANNGLWTEQEYIETATELQKTGVKGITGSSDTMTALMKFKTANDLTDEEVGQTLAILSQRENFGEMNETDKLLTLSGYLNQIQMSADESPADVSDVIKAMSYSDPLARTSNMDFASEMALIAGFSQGGYTGSQGGTMLRRTLTNLPASELKLESLSKTKSEGLESVGLLDYWGQFVDEYNQYDSSNDADYTKRFGALEKYMNGDPYKELYGTEMSENQRMSFAYQLLGTQGEALPSLLEGMGFDSDMVNKFAEAFSGTGVEDKYQEKATTFDGAMTLAENALGRFKNQLGEDISPAIIELGNQFASFLNGDGFDLEAVTGTLDDVVDNIVKTMTNIIGEENAEKLGNFLRKLADVAGTLGDTAIEALPQVLERLAEVADDFLEGNYIDGIKKLFNIFDNLDLSEVDDQEVASKITGLINFLWKVGSIGDVLTDSGTILSGITGILSLLVLLGKFGGGNGLNLGSLGGAGGSGGLGILSTLFGGGAHGALSFGGTSLATILAPFLALTLGFAGIASAVTQTANETGQTVGQTVKGMFSAIAEGLTNNGLWNFDENGNFHLNFNSENKDNWNGTDSSTQGTEADRGVTVTDKEIKKKTLNGRSVESDYKTKLQETEAKKTGSSSPQQESLNEKLRTRQDTKRNNLNALKNNTMNPINQNPEMKEIQKITQVNVPQQQQQAPVVNVQAPQAQSVVDNNTNVNTNTNVNANTQVAVSSPFNASLSVHIGNVTANQTITRTISGNRANTSNTNNAVSQSDRSSKQNYTGQQR